MPVRHIGLCYRSVSGRIPRGAGRRAIMVESTLERDFVLLQQFDPAVAGIEEQPVKIPCGRSFYIPDFLIHYHDPAQPPWLVEIKYASDPALVAGELEAKFSAAQSYSADQGWHFSVVTDQDIRTPFLTNITFLLPYRKRSLDPRLRLALFGHGPMGVQQLAEHVAQRITMAVPQVIAAIWCLVARRELPADLNHPLTMQSIIGEARL